MPLTQEDLKLYFSGDYTRPGYDECVEKAEGMRIHADGTYPGELIEERRPHESEMVRDYRQKIWKAITKPYFGKVLSSLSKIRRSTEWSIRFPEEPPKRIAVGENLEAYINSKIPRHTSLTNWAFSVLLREYAIDANAWVAVIPEEVPVNGSEYIKPRPVIFRCDQVVDFGDDFFVAKSDEVSIYQKNGIDEEGAVYYVITLEYYQRWNQVSDKPEFDLVWEQTHTVGQLPAFQMRGVVIKAIDDYIINETRLEPMRPRLDEAVREYSDLQAEVVQHIHSEKWEIGQKECATCKGRGYLSNDYTGSRTNCEVCNGVGWEPRGPYTTLMVEPPMGGEANKPIPPAGYIQKDTNIVTVQDQRIEKHIYHALAAVNMEFLTQAPVAESGVAKAYDADETNNFVHAVAEDIVAMLDSIVFYISELRYNIAVPNANDRLKLLPVINVPDRFDLFSAAIVEQELNTAKERNINPVILNALEAEYANKKFSNDPSVQARISLVFRLDPLSNITEENKVLMLQNGGITKETYIVSCNIHAFIARAFDEKGEQFLIMPLAEQKALIASYAQEQIAANSAAKQVMAQIAGA